MLSGNHLVGVLNVNLVKDRRHFSLGQVKALSILVSTAAAALENARLHGQVRATEERFRALIEHSADAIALMAGDGRLLYASPSSTRILGYAVSDMLGADLAQYVHPDDLPPLRAALAGLSRPGQAATAQYRFRHQDGSWRWLEASIQDLLAEPSVAAIVYNYRDVTERKQHERELEAFAAVSRALRAATTPDEMLPILLRQVQELLRADSVAIGMRDDHGEALIWRAASGEFAAWRDERQPVDQGISGQVMASSQPFTSDDLQTDSRFERLVRTLNAVTAACVPLMAQAETLGVIWVARQEPFSAVGMHVLTAVADIAGSALQRAGLHAQTARRLQHLEALHGMDMVLTAGKDLGQTLEALLGHVTAQLQVDAADVLLLDDEARHLEYAAGRGFRAEAAPVTRLPVAGGVAGRAVLQGRRIYIPDMSALSITPTRAAQFAAEGFVAYYAVPLIAKGKSRACWRSSSARPLRADDEWPSFWKPWPARPPSPSTTPRLFDGPAALQPRAEPGLRRHHRGLVARARPARPRNRGPQPARHRDDPAPGPRPGRDRRRAWCTSAAARCCTTSARWASPTASCSSPAR